MESALDDDSCLVVDVALLAQWTVEETMKVQDYFRDWLAGEVTTLIPCEQFELFMCVVSSR